MRILLVDDDANLRTLLRTTFEVSTSTSPRADGSGRAERREGFEPDVLVLDVSMPGMKPGSRSAPTAQGRPRERRARHPALDRSRWNRGGLGRGRGGRLPPQAVQSLELLAAVEGLAGKKYRGSFPVGAKRRPESSCSSTHETCATSSRSRRGSGRCCRAPAARTVWRSPRRVQGHGHARPFAARAAIRGRARARSRARAARGSEHRVRLPAPRRREDRDPDRILQKPEPLSPAEQRLMRTHTISASRC